MAVIEPPILMKKHINVHDVSPNHILTSIQSNKYAVVREKDKTKLLDILLVDIENPEKSIPLGGWDAIVSPNGEYVVVTSNDKVTLTMRNMKTGCVLKRFKLAQVQFRTWVNPKMLGLVTKKAVFHWLVDRETRPKLIFNIHFSLNYFNISNYISDPAGEVFILSGSYIEWNMDDFYYMQTFRWRDGTGFIIEGIGPTFCSFITSTGIERTYLCYMLPRETVGELHIMGEMGNRETERVVNFWLTDLEDGNDYVCNLRASDKYGIVFLLTVHGRVHLFDVESGDCIYKARICDRLGPEEYFDFTDTYREGIIAVNRKGLIASASINEETILPYLRTNGPVQVLKRLTGASSPEPAVKKKAKKKKKKKKDMCGEDEGEHGCADAKERVNDSKQEVCSDKSLEESPDTATSTDVQICCSRDSSGRNSVRKRTEDICHKNPVEDISLKESGDCVKSPLNKRTGALESQSLIAEAEITLDKELSSQLDEKCYIDRKIEKDEKSSTKIKSLIVFPSQSPAANAAESIPVERTERTSDFVESKSPTKSSTSTGETSRTETGDSDEGATPPTTHDPSHNEANPQDLLDDEIDVSPADVKEDLVLTPTSPEEATTASPREDKKYCIICYERECNTVLVPCGHMWFCYECASAVNQRQECCPACRAHVTTVVRVYTLA